MSRARELARLGGSRAVTPGNSRTVGFSTFASDAHFEADVTVDGDLNVAGDLSYDQTTAGNQRITGISTLNQTETTDIIVSAGATVTGALDVDGGANINDGKLTVGTGNTDVIVRGDMRVTGIASFGNGTVTINETTVKTGTSNLHDVGIEIAGINVLGADTPIGQGATIFNNGNAVFTGQVTAGSMSMGGSIIPDANDTYDLGSPSRVWRDLYLGPGSLYINGQKVLEENSSNIIVSCDANQNLVLQTSGSGDVELDPTGTGIVQVKGTLQIQDGTNITNSSGNAVTFGSGLGANSLTTKDSDTTLTLSGQGSGSVQVSDSLTVTGGLTVNGTIGGSGASLTNVPNSALVNSSATVTAGDALTGGGTLTLGSSVTLDVNVDDSSVEVSSDAIRVKASGVTNAMLAGSIANSKLSNSSLSYGGVSLSLGGSDATPAFNLEDASGLPISSGVSGLGANVATFLGTPSSNNLRAAVTGETGSGALVFGTSPTLATPSISGGTFTGRQELDDASLSGGLTVGAGLTVTGDLVVNGTTTTINSTTISVDDKHIELGATSSPDDTSADGGGIILKGDTDHTILWHNDNDHWQSSEHFNLASGRTYQIADTGVLSATTLGSGVVNSSLTSVGTINSGVWQGTAIANAYLANSTVSLGGVSIALGGSNATPAFNLSDATDLPTTSLTGTITNAQLAGSIANSKLSNSSVSLGGVSVSLGGSDATPAFNLSDATNLNASAINAGTIGDAYLPATISSDITGTAQVATTVTLTATNSASGFHYITFSDSTTGNENMRTDTGLRYIPSTGELDTSILSAVTANISGNCNVTGNVSGTWNGDAIANSKLANSSVSLGGVSVSLGGSDATPAFDLSDATGLPTSSLSGTITNAQLAGSIANSKLSNSTIQLGGITVSLGGGDSTPAFNLADATGYPVGSIANLGTNVATFLNSPTSANLRAAVTGETGSGSLVFGTNPTIAGMTVSNHVVPNANGTINLGASGTRFANVFSSDLDLSNEAKGVNTVDGTWGSYLIEEGEEHLYITNRRSGKKFRFMLEEV